MLLKLSSNSFMLFNATALDVVVHCFLLLDDCVALSTECLHLEAMDVDIAKVDV